MSREVVIVDAYRSAFGRMGGTLKDIKPTLLASAVLKGLVEKTGITEKGKVDCVMMGSAMHDVNAMNPARWATIHCGLPYETSASYVEMQCGSGIDSINHAAWKIIADQADIIIAGGFESYSQAFAKFPQTTAPYRMIPPAPAEIQIAPWKEDNIGMGLTAENLQVMYNIPREATDEFAYNSQRRAGEAIAAGKFKDEIIPITVPGGRKQPDISFVTDEHVRADTTLEALAKLKPVFKEGGVTTAGNSSGRNDGAAFFLMMSAEKAKELGYKPMAKWLAGADVGCDPKIMGIAPGYAMPMAIKRAGLKLSDMAHLECNEAFAVQNLAVIKEVENQTGEKVNMDIWNPLGGAIAFGHPNGASGPRIGMFTMRELIRNGGKYGVFGTCCGGGLGVATVIENLQR